MEFKKLQISDLKPASYNPRKELKPGDKEYEKIKNSITEFGYVDPVIVNDDMTVIGGHQRLNVLKDLGYQGEEIGKGLEIILKKVIAKELKNNPDKLYAYALELKYHLNEVE